MLSGINYVFVYFSLNKYQNLFPLSEAHVAEAQHTNSPLYKYSEVPYQPSSESSPSKKQPDGVYDLATASEDDSTF